jgi:hypothetical protein
MKNVLVRTSSMRAVNSNVHRAGSVQHVQNPISENMVEIEMSSRNNNRPEVIPLSKNSGGETKKKNRTKNKKNKTKSRKMHPNKQQVPKKKTAAQQERRNKLKSLHVKRQSLDAINASKSVLVEKERGVDAVGTGTNTHRRKSFLKIDDEEHGVYFQDVDTKETVWMLPEDGDVVANDNELQHNPMNRRSFNKIEDEEHGVYFQDAETEETVWELPENGLVL